MHFGDLPYNQSMSAPILATKVYIPPARPRLVLRRRLIEGLNDGWYRKLTLVSAAAGFGKTTLLGEWVAGLNSASAPVGGPEALRVAWLSLDEGDSNPVRFLAYLIAALQTIFPGIGAGVLAALESPQPPPVEALLTALLNEIAAVPGNFVLVLDDYHMVDARAVDQVLAFLLEHLPPQMHLVIATREDPQLPLARYRVRDQLAELRAADLRFTPAEAAEFLNRVMDLSLSAEDIAVLEDRTEGWIAGLQLAALALQGTPPTPGFGDRARFIDSFTGGHHFVLDYLMEEVLERQSESIQTFLLRTSILERMCGPLCEAVVYGDAGPVLPAVGQDTLEHLERANLFVVPLDGDRRWYRYHHLFGELLRQRLHSRASPAETRDPGPGVAELHIRASAWYEANGLGFEAFRHAAATNDIARADRLVNQGRVPLHSPGAVTAVLDWLASLPRPTRDARPSLWVKSATLALVVGRTAGVDESLDAAEAALQGVEIDATIRDLYGQIAEARATLALTRYQIETVIVQSRRALEYLHPGHLSFRSNAYWTLGLAYFLAGERVAARQALANSLTAGEASARGFSILLSTIALGQVQESDNQLYEAAETYRRSLQLAGDPALSIAYEAQLGLGRISYQWNDLDAAQHHGAQGLKLALQYDKAVDRFISCEVFLAGLQLARGDTDGAAAMLAKAEQSARERSFVQRLPEIAAAQAPLLLRQGNVAAAAVLAEAHQLPLSRARVHLAQGDASAALAALEPLRRQAEAKRWEDERLKVTVLQALACDADGRKDRAAQLLGEALVIAEPGGFIRLFLDEGPPMERLLREVLARGIAPAYARRLLAAFAAPSVREQPGPPEARSAVAQPLIEPLSQRELEILQLIAQGLSNREIGERLFLALDTVKGYNRRIYDKLQVQRRTEALARARELGLL
jgi:LuxR family maltose regulon positive regulatory protein